MTTLAQALPRPRERSARLALDVGLIVLASLIVAASAQLTVHLRFVPITMQTLAVLLVGATLGSLRGGGAIALYLAEGAAGLPFFAEGKGGVDYLVLRDPLHASGGYLWGFLLAAIFVGFLAERGWDRNVGSALGAMFLGNVAIYLIGLPWLASAIGTSIENALPFGLYPFIIGDTIKLLLAAGALPIAWRLVGRER
ncbi:MAG TPA: biotin transporter BioY [Actinomycetota bacterium]|nr:biotin transporter BioY [Actinomycetota bacterium]